MMTIDPPETRTCERCGRQENWENGTWRVSKDKSGQTYCIHEWDITGDYSPIQIES